jgi:hypothetical protein
MNTATNTNPVLDNTLFETAFQALSSAISRNDGEYMELIRTGADANTVAATFERGCALQRQFLNLDPSNTDALSKIIEEHRHGPA